MAVSRKAMTEGIRTEYIDNPSVKNQRFLPAPFTQGSRGCSRTSAFFDGSWTLAGDCHTSLRTGSQ